MVAGRRLVLGRTAPPRLIGPGNARLAVEEALGRPSARARLTLDFEPAIATRWDLLIDGAAFFPAMLADIEAATSDVHILIFGFKAGEIGNRFRDLLVRKVGEGVDVRIITEAAFSQPGRGSKPFYDSMVAGGVQVVANQGAFLDLDGLLQDRKVDWQFKDFGHFDIKVIVIDGRVARRRAPASRTTTTGTHDLMPRLEGDVAQLQRSSSCRAVTGRAAPGGRGRARPVLPEIAGAAGDEPDRRVRCGSSRTTRRGPPPDPTAFRDAVDGAQRRLCVISPYLADHPCAGRGLIEPPAAGRRPGHRAGNAPLPASGSVRTGSRRCMMRASTSASTPRWPTPRSCWRTTWSSPGPRTSTR